MSILLSARASEIRSLLDRAQRQAKEADDGLTHDEKVALRADVDRIGEFFRREFSADGAHGFAVFCSSPADLFEAPWAEGMDWVRCPLKPSSGPPGNFAALMAWQWLAIPAVAARRRIDVVHGLSRCST